MPELNNNQTQNNYDPRWFIWTIVFLVSTGIMLVTYIVSSDSGTNDIAPFVSARAASHKTTER